MLRASFLRCHGGGGHSHAANAAGRKVVSPADVAKRVAAAAAARVNPEAAAAAASDAAATGDVDVTPTPRPVVRGGVQKEILGLYRDLLKATKKDAPVAASPSPSSTTFALNEAQLYVREQFRRNRTIPRRNIEMIQYHVHYANKKLEELREGKTTRTAIRTISFGP